MVGITVFSFFFFVFFPIFPDYCAFFIIISYFDYNQQQRTDHNNTMKLHQSLSSILAVLATFQMIASSSDVHVVQAKEKRNIKGYNNRNLLFDSTTTEIALPMTTSDDENIVASSSSSTAAAAAVRSSTASASFSSSFSSSSSSSSSSSNDIDLRQKRGMMTRKKAPASSSNYFFEECYDTCKENGGIPTMPDGSTTMKRPASTSDFKSNKDLYCCKGGVSYLKVQFGIDIEEGNKSYSQVASDATTGTITFDASVAMDFAATAAAATENSKMGTNTDTTDDMDDHSWCVLTSLFKYTKKSTSAYLTTKGTKAIGGTSYTTTAATAPSAASSAFVQIIPCDDDCIKFPFDSVRCTTSSSSIGSTTMKNVGPGTEICFGMVDPSTGLLLYGTQMPIEVHVWYLHGNGQVLSGIVHTSCSKPLVKPFAVGTFLNFIPHDFYFEIIATQYYYIVIRCIVFILMNSSSFRSIVFFFFLSNFFVL